MNPIKMCMLLMCLCVCVCFSLLWQYFENAQSKAISSANSQFNRIFFKGLSVVSSNRWHIYTIPTESLFLYDNRHNFAAQFKMRTATEPCVEGIEDIHDHIWWYLQYANRLHHHLHYTHRSKLIHKHHRQ